MKRREFLQSSLAAGVASGYIANASASPRTQAAVDVARSTGKTIAFVLYPGMTPLDIVGPAMALDHHGFNIEYVWHERKALATEIPCLSLTPTTTFQTLQKVDILCITGTHNPIDVIADAKLVEWVNRVGQTAGYVTSVCTGALVLAAAGLLDGYRASTHWSFAEILGQFGAIPSQERVTVDRNRITGGGVTSALDFGLQLLATLRGEDTAKLRQLIMQYDPHPPFVAGTPAQAGPELTQRAIAMTKAALDRETPDHRAIVAAAIARKAALPRG